MTIERSFLMPHPPIVIDAIGQSEIRKCKKTQRAMQSVAREIEKIKPEVIVVISPHGTVFSDAVSINYSNPLAGDLGMFGHSEIQMTHDNHMLLAEEIADESAMNGVNCALLDEELKKRLNVSTTLDHGVIVPLYYVDELYSDYQLVHINYGTLSPISLYQFGQSIRQAIENLDLKTVVIASGDLSHKLSNQGPYSYAEEGPVFDKKIIQLMDEKEIEEIVLMDSTLVQKAGECGKRSIDILCGTLDGYSFESHVYSYEGPFGVGYGVVGFSNFSPSSKEKRLENFKKKEKEIITNRRSSEDAYVRLARQTINRFIEKDQKIDPTTLDLPEKMFQQRAGVFVSIKKNGGLRGCIGTTGRGITSNIAQEIVRNAIEAATNDPRFPAITSDELEELSITVDVLKPSEPVESLNELDPEKYGIIVEAGYRRGLLLPRLDSVDTVDKQLEIALQKAGIQSDEDYSVEKFEVTRHK